MFYISQINGHQLRYTGSKYQELKVQKISEIGNVSAPVEMPDDNDSTSDNDSTPNKDTFKKQNPYAKLDQENPVRERALRAEQIMSAPVETALASSLVSEISELISLKRFRHIPVLNEEQKLVGIISDRDLRKAKNPDSPISEIMAKNVISAHPETGIRTIAEILFQERIGCMPITNEDGVLVGLITRSDILRTIINKAPLELWI